MNVGLAREKLAEGGDPAEATRLLDTAHTTAKEAIVEMRDLARGIHPPVLDAGAGHRAGHARGPQRRARPGSHREITDRAGRRSRRWRTSAPPSCSTNVGQAQRRPARRGSTRAHRRAAVAAGLRRRSRRRAHDGAGTGLAGLADRVATVDGRLTVDSPAGGPTAITVRPAGGARRENRHRRGQRDPARRPGATADRPRARGRGRGRRRRRAALRRSRADPPDVCVVDIRMPPSFTDEGLRAAIAVRRSHPDVGVLVFSQYIETRYAAELLAGSAARRRVPAEGPGGRRARVRRCAAPGWPPAGPRSIPRSSSSCSGATRRRDAPGPAHRPRAGGAAADGRGAVERGHRRRPGRVRAGGREARREHLHEVRPARRRRPTTAGCWPSCATWTAERALPVEWRDMPSSGAKFAPLDGPTRHSTPAGTLTRPAAQTPAGSAEVRPAPCRGSRGRSGSGRRHR